jgi:hypothetical protein
MRPGDASVPPSRHSVEGVLAVAILAVIGLVVGAVVIGRRKAGVFTRRGSEKPPQRSPLHFEPLPGMFRWMHGYSRLGEPAMQVAGVWHVTASGEQPITIVQAYVQHRGRKTEGQAFAMADGSARPARECRLGAERRSADITMYALVVPDRREDGMFRARVVFVDSQGNVYPQWIEFLWVPSDDPG